MDIHNLRKDSRIFCQCGIPAINRKFTKMHYIDCPYSMTSRIYDAREITREELKSIKKIFEETNEKQEETTEKQEEDQNKGKVYGSCSDIYSTDTDEKEADEEEEKGEADDETAKNRYTFTIMELDLDKEDSNLPFSQCSCCSGMVLFGEMKHLPGCIYLAGDSSLEEDKDKDKDKEEEEYEDEEEGKMCKRRKVE